MSIDWAEGAYCSMYTDPDSGETTYEAGGKEVDEETFIRATKKLSVAAQGYYAQKIEEAKALK